MTVIDQRAAHIEAARNEGTRYKVTERRVLRAEWFKFWTLRSSWITLAVAAVVMLGFGWIASASYSPGQTQSVGGPPGSSTVTDVVGLALSGTNLALLAIGVLGVLFGASEYSTGLIKATLAAVPKRWPVLAAKAAVIGTVSLVAATAGAFLAFLVGATAVDDSIALTLGDSGVVRSLLGAGVYLALVGVLSVGLGMLLRSVASSVAVLIGTFLLLPNLIGLLPDSLNDAISSYLPSNAGSSMMSLTTGSGSLSPSAGFAVMVGWVVLVLGAAAYQLRRRDA